MDNRKSPSGDPGSFGNERTRSRGAQLTPLVFILTAGLFGASGLSIAQEFSVEGPLQEVNGPPSSVRCNGATIDVSAATFTSPTATLQFSDLNTGDFESSSQGPGFIGGTCIIDGATEPNADTVFVELAENVIVGTAAAVVGAQPPPPATPALFSIFGVNVVPIADCRMPTAKNAAGFFNENGTHPGNGCPGNAAFKELVRNEFGFGIDPATAAGLSAGEGYLGTDSRLYAHTIEAGEGTALNNTPRASIQRAQCRDRGNNRLEIEIRGGCVTNANATVRIERSNGVNVGTATCTVDPEFPGFGVYRFTNSNLQQAGGCPAQFRVCLSCPSADPKPAGTLFDFADSTNR